MNKYDWFVIVGLIIWLAETAFFGFNPVAVTGMEKALDFFTQGLIIYGALCGIATGIKTNVIINNPAGTTSESK